MGNHLIRRTCALLVVAGLIHMPGSAEAQQRWGIETAPRLTVSLSGGLFLPRADSDVFDLMTDRLVLSRSDLRGVGFEAEVGALLADRFEMAAGLGMSRSTNDSQFRNRTDEAGQPIIQNTRLTIGPTVHLSGKAHLFPRTETGRVVNPFVLLGVGRITKYELRLDGRFYDEQEEVAFDGDFRSKGRATPVFAGLGLSTRLSEGILLTGSAQHRWASAPLGGDFRDLDSIDLSGFGVSLGLSYLR